MTVREVRGNCLITQVKLILGASNLLEVSVLVVVINLKLKAFY